MSGGHNGFPVQKEIAEFCFNRKAVTHAAIFRRTTQLDRRAHSKRRSAASILISFGARSPFESRSN